MNFYEPTIEDIKKIKNALKNNTKMGCEMSPANTVLWASHYKTKIGFWDGEIVFCSTWEKGIISFSCNLQDSKNPKALFDELVKESHSKGQKLRMHCLQETEIKMIEMWYPGQYMFTTRRGDFDYIYLREKLATLAGKKLHGKRNHIHRFEEAYPDWKYERICAENENECAIMAMEWCRQNCRSEDESLEQDKVDESRLVVYAIKHRDELGMIGGALRVDGKIIAITLGEPLTKDTFVVHFEKAFSQIQGAYPMINREFVRNELQEFEYVNREEDLGLEGLRKAKLSYRPEIILEKALLQEI